MQQIQQGRWEIDSILINSRTVMNFDGFEYLEIAQSNISIQPIGIHFTVTESTSSTAILQSTVGIYYVNFEVQENELKIGMTRPRFSETFELTAKLHESLIAVS